MPKVSLCQVVMGTAGCIGLALSPLASTAVQANSAGVPAMYATKAEAEEAAKKHFNCTGAHAMGNQWMPCATHGQPNSNSQHNH
jgi:hypothetical protein